VTATIIDGKKIAADIELDISRKILKLRRRPCLAVVLCGDNPASEIYVSKKQEACRRVGIESRLVRLFQGGEPYNAEYELTDKLQHLNHDPDVDGILVQLPLPPSIIEWRVFDKINPEKDVDVLTPMNVGLLVQGLIPRFKPCTPHGIQVMLNRSGISVAEKHVVVINRSNIVGKPLSSMLIQDCNEYANATVTVCHNRTPPEQLKTIARSADIVIVAVGIPGFLTADMVKPGAVVVDVGITRVGKKVLGDVDFEMVKEVAGFITPVPGGVGPMTVTMLLENTLRAAEYFQTKRGGW
jgi:methylenetetrahydrofolate dehydrogenase (NADP+)/methenyltetrahydrofolate cyclohydrolase